MSQPLSETLTPKPAIIPLESSRLSILRYKNAWSGSCSMHWHSVFTWFEHQPSKPFSNRVV